MHLVTLHAGDASAVLAPEIGGAVVRYASHRGPTTIDWLRSTTAEALLGADPYYTGGFPLVPYSNRIREGCFTFQGRAVALPPNSPPERHSIHGHGWQVAWTPSRSRPRTPSSSTATRAAPGPGRTGPGSA